MPNQQVNDVNFYYELHGKGPTLILVNGYNSDLTLWKPTMELLKDHFQILLFDNQATGQTVDHGGPLTAEQMADNIVALAHSLNLTNPHIAGISMGGTIVQKIASRHGYKINKIALLVTSAKWRKAMLIGLRSILTLRERELEFEDIFAAILPWVFGEEFLSNQEKISAFKKDRLEYEYPQSVEDQKRQFEVLAQFDGEKDLQKIKAPTLILHTPEDIISLPHESEYLAKHIVNSTLIECSGGHGIAIESPDIVAEHFKKFFLD